MYFTLHVHCHLIKVHRGSRMCLEMSKLNRKKDISSTLLYLKHMLAFMLHFDILLKQPHNPASKELHT